MSNKVLIITGMHRSGTSLVSQYLSECGLHVGDNLLTFDSVNPESAYNGHHEDKDFFDFHVQILAKKRIYSFPTNEFRVPINVRKSDREKAVELIKSRAHLPQWGWKDPRTTLFLNMWDEVIENPKYLFLYREPLLVLDSILRRGTDKSILQKPIIGLRAWKVFNKQIIRFWNQNKEKSIILNIDNITQNPEMMLDDLKKKLDIHLNKVPFEKVYSKKAIKEQTSEVLDNFKKKYPREINSSIQIYNQLQELSENN
ncbi:MAG: hypothetical protein ACFB02_02545 [Mastigocoleus sp.]|mgnify:CR=1 FL=1